MDTNFPEIKYIDPAEQARLDAEYEAALAVYDAAQAAYSKEQNSETEARLEEAHGALNAAEWERKKPTFAFARYATKALGGDWTVMPSGPGKVSVTSPSGATCRYDVDATKEAVIEAAKSLAKSFWSWPDTSTGSTGESWWDEK